MKWRAPAGNDSAGLVTIAASTDEVSAPEPDTNACRARYSFVPESKSKLNGAEPMHQPACHSCIARSSIGEPCAANAGSFAGQSFGVGAKCKGTTKRSAHEHASARLL